MKSFIKDALVLVEDRRFFTHWGVDFFAIARAFLVNVKERRYAQGGSTITQQLARTKYLYRKKTIFRKVLEIVMALYLEFKFTKDEILDMYMSEVYMGQRKNGTSIYGFDDAAKYWFGDTLEWLNYAEAVALVAMVKGPNLYRLNSKSGVARRTMLLGLMLDYDLITQDQLMRAVNRRSL